MNAKIEICMGSSCFSRGNPAHLRVIQDYLAQRGLSASIRLTGHLCEDKCSGGPNMRINGRLYQHVTPASAIAALEEVLKSGG